MMRLLQTDSNVEAASLGPRLSELSSVDKEDFDDTLRSEHSFGDFWTMVSEAF
jgi:hypothetical protein